MGIFRWAKLQCKDSGVELVVGMTQPENLTREVRVFSSVISGIERHHGDGQVLTVLLVLAAPDERRVERRVARVRVTRL